MSYADVLGKERGTVESTSFKLACAPSSLSVVRVRVREFLAFIADALLAAKRKGYPDIIKLVVDAAGTFVEELHLVLK